jgi:hypothetical protein
MRSATGAMFSINISPMRPRSTGSVTITSADPLAPPRIRFNYLTDPADLDVMLAAVEEARRLAAVPSLAALAIQELYPGSRSDLRASVLSRVARVPWWTRPAQSMGYRGCQWWTPRSCPRSRRQISTSRPSCWPSGARTCSGVSDGSRVSAWTHPTRAR